MHLPWCMCLFVMEPTLQILLGAKSRPADVVATLLAAGAQPDRCPAQTRSGSVVAVGRGCSGTVSYPRGGRHGLRSDDIVRGRRHDRYMTIIDFIQIFAATVGILIVLAMALAGPMAEAA